MTQVSIKSVLIGAVLILVLLVALNIAVIFSHVRGESSREWAAHSFSGAVVAVSPGVLKVKDVRGVQRLFRLDDHTLVWRGRTAVSAVALVNGSYVVVETDRESGDDTARIIRIVTSKKTTLPK